VSQASDTDTAWKSAREDYGLGTNGPDTRDERRRQLEEGIAAARRAIAIAPERPEGFFWLAANMGSLADIFGRREGLRYRNDIRNALQKVLAIDPGYLHGAAERALGRWYANLPAAFGGNKRLAEEHLRKSLTYGPDSAISCEMLAEVLVDTGRRDEARRLIASALAAPVDPDWESEDGRFRTRARELLAKLDREARK
jgi:tetratricopeptide (TPR) repeat protein